MIKSLKSIIWVLAVFVLLGFSHITHAAEGDIDQTFLTGVPTSMDGAVAATAIQSDGKIVIGGSFSNYNGTLRNRVARLNTDGSIDDSFNPGSGCNGNVNAVVIQSDGKIVISGMFNTYNGVTKNKIARLNADGSLDATFNSSSGTNSDIYSMAIQPDGKIIIGGAFSTYNGTTRYNIARINTNGSIDSTFTSAMPQSAYIGAIAIQSDGKIMVGGWTYVASVFRGYVARLNANGTVDGTFSGTVNGSNGPNAISIQSDGKIIIGGYFTAYNGTSRNNIARLYSNGTLDTTFNVGSGLDSGVSALATQSDGKILAGGAFTTYNGVTRKGIARINADGSLDAAFNPGSGVNGGVSAISVQSDNKIIIGGSFSTFNGVTRMNIARINTDGAMESAFDVGSGANSLVTAVATQSDGKIIIGGNFTTYNGIGRNYIARLNLSGSLDTTFDPGSGLSSNPSVIIVQSDGKILIGGNFTAYNGTARNYIARLNCDGSLDMGFDPGTGANSYISAMAIQSDGKILIGGNFTAYNSTARYYIARINTDGTLDATFNPGSGPDNAVRCISVQSDGKIIIGGSYFTTYNGTSRNRIARLNSNGSLDTSFNPGVGVDTFGVNSIVIQSSGKIIIFGQFTAYNGSTRNRIARINADGTLDTTFNSGSGADNVIYSSAVQVDGKILIFGAFQSYNGTARKYIARINADGSLDTSFNPGTGLNAYVGKVFLQSDGNILIGGNFTNYNGTPVAYFARLIGTATINTPSITTQNPTSISAVGAIGNADLNSTGGEEPTRYIEWGVTSGAYTNSCSAGTGSIGVYSCAMISLSPSTIYYVRAKATNSTGTSHGEEVSFTTLSAQAAVITGLVNNILTTAATGNATITDIGGENPMREIQWGTTSGNYTNSCSANAGGTGAYVCQLTSLSPNTTYYLRAMATNSAGTSYGEETSFTTLPSQVTITDPDTAKMTNAVTTNYMSVNSGTITATPQITTNTNVIIQDGIVKMDIPSNTQITKTDSGNFNFQNFVAESATSIVKQAIPNSISAVKVGVTGTKISFSQPITISIDVDSGYNGRTLDVLYQNDGETDWHSQTSCTITSGKCTFQTNHATTYSVNGSGNMAGETGININTDIQEVIALDCGATAINLGNITPGTPITGSSTCTATTNANGGYNLSVRRDDATSTLKKNTENSVIISDLTPWDPTTPNSNTWSGTGLGFTVYNSTANKNSSWWGTGIALTDSNNKYAGFNTTQADIMRNSTYSASSTATDIGYMLNVPPTQKSGAYSGSVTYQAVTTP